MILLIDVGNTNITCGVYEGEELPSDIVCPLCKHGADDFEPLK